MCVGTWEENGISGGLGHLQTGVASFGSGGGTMDGVCLRQPSGQHGSVMHHIASPVTFKLFAISINLTFEAHAQESAPCCCWRENQIHMVAA